MDERALEMERRLAPIVLVATLLVVPSIVFEASVDPGLRTVGRWLNWGTYAVFLVEMIAILAVTRERMAYFRERPLEWLIVLLTPPVLPFLTEAGRTLRLLRLLRLVRAARLARKMFDFGHVGESLLIVFFSILGGGVALDVLEDDIGDPLDGIWWSFNMAFTGEQPALGAGARVVAAIVILLGVVLVSYVTGAIAAAFVQEEQHDDLDSIGRSDLRILDTLERMEARLERLERQLDADGRPSRG